MADIFQILKYDEYNTNNTFIWKHPAEEFNTGTQLIVNESQEAIFFMNGQALDLFGPGLHTLETQNIPLIRDLLNRPANDQSPFHCEVYYINKAKQMSIEWWTDSKVLYIEPTYQFPLTIGASGEMCLLVNDSRRLLEKIAGTKNLLEQSKLNQLFRAFLMVRIKPYLAQAMQNSNLCIFEVDSHMSELSDILHNKIIQDFSEYGLSLARFFVTAIVKPDGDKAYEKFKDIHIRQHSDIAESQFRQQAGEIDSQTIAQKMVIEPQATATESVQIFYTYQQERGFDAAEKVTRNEVIGEFSNMGIEPEMIGGASGGIDSAVDRIAANSPNPSNPQQGAAQGNMSASATEFDVVSPQVDNLNYTTPTPEPILFEKAKVEIEHLAKQERKGNKLLYFLVGLCIAILTMLLGYFVYGTLRLANNQQSMSVLWQRILDLIPK